MHEPYCSSNSAYFLLRSKLNSKSRAIPFFIQIWSWLSFFQLLTRYWIPRALMNHQNDDEWKFQSKYFRASNSSLSQTFYFNSLYYKGTRWQATGKIFLNYPKKDESLRRSSTKANYLMVAEFPPKIKNRISNQSIRSQTCTSKQTQRQQQQWLLPTLSLDGFQVSSIKERKFVIKWKIPAFRKRHKLYCF